MGLDKSELGMEAYPGLALAVTASFRRLLETPLRTGAKALNRCYPC